MAVKRNLTANFIGQGWTALMGMVFIPVYIKYLGMDSYGLIAIFGLLHTWLALLDMGMAPTLNREMARFVGGLYTPESIRDLLRSVETFAVSIAVLIIAGVWLASGWLATNWIKSEALSDHVVSNAIAIMGLVIGLRFVENIYKSCIIGLQRQALLNAVVSSLATLRGLGAVAVLAWFSPTIDAYFYWQAFISVLALGLLAVFTYVNIPKPSRQIKFSLAALISIRSFLAGMFGTTLLSMLLMQIDKVMLSKLLTLSEYGYYALAVVVAGAVNTISAPITQAIFPRLSALHAANDEKTFNKVFHSSCQMISVLLGSASIILMIYSSEILALWSSNQAIVANASALVSVLALGNLLNGLLRIPHMAQLAHGWTSLAVKINIFAVIVVVPLIYFATHRFGALGAAWVWVALNTAYMLVASHIMFNRIMSDQKWNWYVKDVAMPIVGAAIGLIAFKLLFTYPTTTPGQIAFVVTATMATSGCSLMMATDLRSHTAQILKRLTSRSRLFTNGNPVANTDRIVPRGVQK